MTPAGVQAASVFSTSSFCFRRLNTLNRCMESRPEPRRPKRRVSTVRLTFDPPRQRSQPMTFVHPERPLLTCEILNLEKITFLRFLVFLLSRKMKTTRKTPAPSAPAGPSTGRRDDGAASLPPQTRPPGTAATPRTSAPSAAPAAARAKASASGRRPAAGAGPSPPSDDPPPPAGPPGRRLKEASRKNRPGGREEVC